MENILENLKAFILANVNARIAELSTEEVPLRQLVSRDVVLGQIDVTRFATRKVMCAIVPNSQSEDVPELGSNDITSSLTVSFICQGYDGETLVKQMCRYGAAFRDAVLDDPSLNDTVEDTEIGERNFYPDVGIIQNQMSAIEIDLTITTEDEI